MTQFVSFSQHPTDPNTLLGGTQDNGSPATNQATTSSNWGNVLGGDGGYNAIDPQGPSNFYASNPHIPPGGLGVQHCSSGVNCLDSTFNFVVTCSAVGGDDGAFYFPYILDPQSSTAMLVGTCRVWRGPRTGGSYYFNVQGLGSDSDQTMHQTGVVLHILSNNPDFTLGEPTAIPTVNAGSTITSGPISVTAVNGFTGTIALTCSLVSGTGSCSVNPATVTSIPSTPAGEQSQEQKQHCD